MNESTNGFTHTTKFPMALSETKVAIWGLGLMGGSLAMALKSKTKALYGIDPDAQICMQAQELKIFDLINTDPSGLLPLADLVVLAAPLEKLPHLLEALPRLHPEPAIVLDLGSTKTNILACMEQLPARFAPIGGHPMCGKEVRSFSNAEVDLYKGASFALLPLARTPQTVCDLVLQLVLAIGAHPIWLDASRHDQWAASISHLPYLVANCLSSVTPFEAAPLVGPGYASTTRLAGESIEMMMDILMNNRENILPCLHKFKARVELIEEKLAIEDYATLCNLFTQGAEQRNAILDAFNHLEEP